MSLIALVTGQHVRLNILEPMSYVLHALNIDGMGRDSD